MQIILTRPDGALVGEDPPGDGFEVHLVIDGMQVLIQARHGRLDGETPEEWAADAIRRVSGWGH